MATVSIAGGPRSRKSLSIVISALLLDAFILSNPAHAIAGDTYQISTVAGTDHDGFGGDGGAATSAQLNYPHGVAMDSAGNFYIADTNNNRIRKVSTSGTITAFAGTGSFGYYGDGGAATAAQLNGPYSVVVDSAGNLYIAEPGNNRIRKVSTTGTITTIAGTGYSGFSGDGGDAASAQLYYPEGVAVDAGGNLYIADTYNNRIRKVSGNGTISTFAGTGTFGFSGDGVAATVANLYIPTGVAVDAAGNLYIAEAGNHRIRKVSTAGIITSIAGRGPSAAGTFSGNDGLATSAQLYSPTSVAVDTSGNIYFVDARNNRIRKLTPMVLIATPTPPPSATTINTTINTTIKTPTKTKAPKKVVCVKGKVQYTFISKCPAGWKIKAGVVKAPEAKSPVVVKTYLIGDIGPGGGFVFYDAGSHQSWGRYLEAAPADVSPLPGSDYPGFDWCGGSSKSIIGTSTAVGSGKANTTKILAVCSSGAARAANEYVAPNGINDWFLPSKDELGLMYTNLGSATPSLGGFTTVIYHSIYYSSSEAGAQVAWSLYFFDGTQVGNDSGFVYLVRAIRAFG
jgi:sugar lactone lactonase YvrE